MEIAVLQKHPERCPNILWISLCKASGLRINLSRPRGLRPRCLLLEHLTCRLEAPSSSARQTKFTVTAICDGLPAVDRLESQDEHAPANPQSILSFSPRSFASSMSTVHGRTSFGSNSDSSPRQPHLGQGDAAQQPHRL